jgi:hypothetical protein
MTSAKINKNESPKSGDRIDKAMVVVLDAAETMICHGSVSVPCTYQALKERAYKNAAGEINSATIESAIWYLRLKGDLLEGKPGELTMVCPV